MSDSEEPVGKRPRARRAARPPKPAQPSTSQQKQRKSTAQSKSKSNPTPENAPPRSLLRLDDKCLTKLFQYLDDVTLCTMANTCKRFRPIAENVFSEHRNELKCVYLDHRSQLRVVRKFGRFITSIDAVKRLPPIVVKAVAKNCRPNLRKLSLAATKIDCNVVKPLFPQLTDVSLELCKFVGDPNGLFTDCPNLTSLYFEPGDECDDYKFLVRNYPNLVELTLDCGPPMDNVIHPMLQSNPQLKNLTLMTVADDDLISNVVECTKNVEQLTIQPSVTSEEPKEQTERGLTQLATLNKLTHLTLETDECQEYAKLIGPLADALSKAKVPLERLDLSDVYIGSKEIESIGKLTKMKVLVLSKITNVKEADLVALTANLPLLTEVQLDFGYGVDKAITTDGLVQMIKNAKHLEYLVLGCIRNLRINEAAFQKLLNAVPIKRKKLTIDIIGCKQTTNFHVPTIIQMVNEKRLKIVHQADITDRCECEHCKESDEETQ